MKTFDLSSLELFTVRVALEKRALNLRLNMMTLERCGLSTDSVSKELEIVVNLLSKLS